MKKHKNFTNKLLILLRKENFLIIQLLDIFAIASSLLFSFWITDNLKFDINLTKTLVFFNLIGLAFLNFSGQYKSIIRYVNSKSYYLISLRVFFLICICSISNYFLKIYILSIKSYLIFYILTTILLTIIRIIIRDIYLGNNNEDSSKSQNVVIYGAGGAGAQLAASLIQNSHFKIKFFVDDFPPLWNKSIYGIPIKPPEKISANVNHIDKILVALPTLEKIKRKEIFDFLQNLGKPILKVPSIDDLNSGKYKIDKLQQIDIEDLLERKEIKTKKELLIKSIQGNSVLVTGGAGSIGSELCNQIACLNPKKLIILDNSELNLYEFEKKLKINNEKASKIFTILGDANNKKLIKQLITKHNVDIIFHAAAYKHVPIVESNPIEGLLNNTFSTLSVCEAVIETNVTRMILVSSDKAVRPTSVMGASKRLAEMIIQAFAERNNNKIFSMVRFGNVLGSSGSVVPLFNTQISKGGPVTVTHKNVIRYFMTIKEASELVLQTLSLTNSGDVFILEMGEPVRIYDLAKKMIRLRGLKIKDNENPNGDIEIKFSKLRPGEKLYEELLIDSTSQKTAHPLIFKGKENFIKYEILISKLSDLHNALMNFDKTGAFEIVKELIPEWNHI